MPNPKAGTVTMNIANAVKEIKSGKIDFKVDKFGIIHTSVGKVSFDSQKLVDNLDELLQTIVKLKPSSAKGTYVKSVSISSTMSTGIKIDKSSISGL
jgi:large subunit ribosomal protein L1